MPKKEQDLLEALQASLGVHDDSDRVPRRAKRPTINTPPPLPKDEHSVFVERQVERFREQLLDLSNRNRLLNFKHPQKSRKQVRVIDELPAVLYERLITGKVFRFKAVDEPQGPRGIEVPVAEAAKQQGLNPDFALGAKPKENAPEHHVDAYIQVLHYPTEMARRLDGMRQEHLTSLQELGVPSLYAVFGFLEWYERQNSETPLLSPLVLVPLEIERSRERGLYQYRVTAATDEPEPNRTLSFRLKQDVGLVLPDLDGLIETEDLDAHFAAVEAAIADMPHWRVRRYVTVCTVSFARQVMYEDLAPERWLQRGGRANHLLRGLLAGVDTATLTATASRSEEPLLVTDSDSTQIAAIKDALAGRSMVVKGPPGTGKSQTITNLIAAALAEKKKVLFVAEKMAALEVVKKRLDDAGLSNFCLALHSTRAKKREVLEALEKAMKARAEAPAPRTATEPRRTERRQALEELEAYLNTIANPVGALGMDARQLVWREQTLRFELGSVLPDLLRLTVPNAGTITTDALQDGMRCLKELEASAQNLKQPVGQSPWAFVTTWDPTHNSLEGLFTCVTQWVHALRSLAAPLVEIGWPADQLAPEDLNDLGAQLADLSHVEANAPAELVGMLLADNRHGPELLKLAADLEGRSIQARRVENVCPVDKALPHRSRLKSLLSHLTDARLIAEGMTYADIKPRVSQRRASTETIISETETLLRHATALGLPTSWDLHAQTTVLQCGRLAAEASRQLLRRRVAESLEEGSRLILEQAAQDAARLRASRTELDSSLTGWDKLGAAELRRHATVLRTTGFFGSLFGSRFKASRTTYLALSTGRSAPREEMAALLQRAAEQLEAEERAITASPRVQRLCGSTYDGLSTDFEHLIRVATWGEHVRNAFPGSDVYSRWARDALFKADAAELAELAEFYTNAGQLLVREVSGATVDLQRLAATELGALERVDAVHATVSQLDVDGRTLLSDLATVSSALEDVATFDARIDASGAKSRLGAFWKGPQTDAKILRAAVSASETIRDIAFPSFVSNWLVSSEFSSKVQHAIALGRGVVDSAKNERYARDQARASGVTIAELVSPGASARDLADRLELALTSGTDELAQHIRYVMARHACGASRSVDAFCRAVEEAGVWTDLPRTFEWTVLRTLAADLMRKQPKLIQEAWSGNRLAQLRESVRTMEVEAVRHRRAKLAADLCSKEVPAGKRTGARKDWTDAALLTHEIGKAKRNIPIRSLIGRAHDAIIALTPCLMMSPLSIAQFLEEPDLQFDLLIVDEASQLRPEESLGALLRAKQVVVVGDELQLPPTSFFKRSEEEALEEDDFEDVAADSLLDLAMNAFGQPRVLRWHYRSRHESLIAFSNAEFYRNELVVPPSPRSRGPSIGVSMEFVHGLYQASTNRPEAERTVQLVFDLMKKHPERSIGVVAINQPQAELIRTLVDERARDVEAGYLDKWKSSLEEFFVKNLENVQGDERDIIVVSLTYGPDPETGKVYQRFTGVNGRYGHRRLNVLFSRAKHQLVLVTSMKADDVRVETGGNRGVQVLRSYLEYATQGAKRSSSANEQQFERLADEIADLGFDVVSGIGSQSLELDLGVTHPDDPGSFVAAIEVDAGETKSLLKPVDRELIRPLVLGRLGWSIVPAWTSDWLREPAVARSRLREGLVAACRIAKKPMPSPRAKVTIKVVEDVAALASGSLVASPPLLNAELRAGDKSLGQFEVYGHRIRVGRGRQCEIRVPDEYEEVAAQHLELKWDRGQFAMTEVDARAGVYMDTTRLSPGSLMRGQNYSLRLGLGVVVLRVAYGARLEPFSAAPPNEANEDPRDTPLAQLMGQLAADERQFLTAVVENGQVRTTELMSVLGKSAVRVNGMVRQLRRKLHDLGLPPYFEDVRLPDGELMYRRA